MRISRQAQIFSGAGETPAPLKIGIPDDSFTRRQVGEGLLGFDDIFLTGDLP